LAATFESKTQIPSHFPSPPPRVSLFLKFFVVPYLK